MDICKEEKSMTEDQETELMEQSLRTLNEMGITLIRVSGLLGNLSSTEVGRNAFRMCVRDFHDWAVLFKRLCETAMITAPMEDDEDPTVN